MIPSLMLEQIKFAVREATAFVAHSFAPEDKEIAELIFQFLTKLGLKCDSGRRPEPKGISEKVRERILGAELFVGIFTRRNQNPDGTFSTSAWTVEEKAAAIAAGKRLLLFVEEGVSDFGGLQGDYEFIRFAREDLSPALLQAIDYVFAVTAIPFQCRMDGSNKLHFQVGPPQDPKKQIEEIKKHIQSQPQNVQARIAYARALSQLGERDTAIGEFKKLASEFPHLSDAHHQLAHAFQQSEDFASAVLSFQRALDLNSSDHKNYRCYGKCLHLQAQRLENPVVKRSTLEKAKRLLERASDLASPSCKAQIAGDMFVVQEALSELQKNKSTEPDSADNVR